MSSKLIGVPVEKLTFVRVLAGLDGFSAGPDGSINTSLSQSSLNGGRMTTHGSLNGVVSDHVYGVFSQSRFAVIGNLIEMTKKNELVSIQPADTFFWSKDGKLNIPNALLFAPKGEKLPQQLENGVQVIRYDANELGKTPFENLRNAITSELVKNKIPSYGISMNGWVRNTYVDPHSDNTKQIAAEFSSNLGYKVLNDLHANTPYASVEQAVRRLQYCSELNDQLSTVKEYEDFTAKSYAEGDVSLLQSADESLRAFRGALKAMPENRNHLYTDLYGLAANSVVNSLNQKLDCWYPEEPQAAPVSTPPPLPSELIGTQFPPPLSSELIATPLKTPDLSQLPEPESHASKFIDDYLRGVSSSEVPVELLQEKEIIMELRSDAEKSIHELSDLLTSKGLLWTLNLEDLSDHASGSSCQYFAEAMKDDHVNRVYDRSRSEMELFGEAFTCHVADVGDYLSQAASQDGIRSDVNELIPFREQLENTFSQDLSLIGRHGISGIDATLQVSRTLASAEPGLIPRNQQNEASFVI